jgi:hypothetical protein
VNSEVVEPQAPAGILRWTDLSEELRESLSGKLAGLWGASDDQEAFDALPIDKQQALSLIASRLQAKRLWHLVRKIDNVYGEGGVGIAFLAWPVLKSTLERRRDFTRFLANHRNTNGGFYEKGQSGAVLHFLYVNGNPRKWYLHFDLHSPVHSPTSAFMHLRDEFMGRVTPDWRMIKDLLKR